MPSLVLILFVALLALAGCRESAEQSALPLPNVEAQPTRGADLAAAEAVSRRFLFAWQNGDFEEMHRLLTFRNRELTPLDEFRAAYQSTQEQLTLDVLNTGPGA